MKNVVELQRLQSPFPKPQAILVDGPTLWLSSRHTRKLYALDRASLQITWECVVPGDDTVWGVTKHEDALYAVCGVDRVDVDERRIRRVWPGKGFDPEFSVACPDGVGSHLSHDGVSLVLSQWYPQKLISIGTDGRAGRVIQTPHQVVGHCFAQGAFWLATTTDEESNEYFIERCDARTWKCEPVARIGFPARGLSFDGAAFWTNHREANQIVVMRA